VCSDRRWKNKIFWNDGVSAAKYNATKTGEIGVPLNPDPSVFIMQNFSIKNISSGNITNTITTISKFNSKVTRETNSVNVRDTEKDWKPGP
jgi:hypothetical protein